MMFTFAVINKSGTRFYYIRLSRIIIFVLSRYP